MTATLELSQARPTYNSEERVKRGDFPHGVRLSPDFLVHGETVTLAPGEIRRVPLRVPTTIRENFPDLKGLRPDLSSFGVHIPSRQAQGGINTLHEVGAQLAALLHQSPQVPEIVEVPLENLSERPRELPPGANVFQLFQRRGPLLRGEQILDAMTKGDIRIEGKRGKRWNFFYSDSGVIEGVDFAVDANNPRWFPPSREPLVIDSATRRFRRFIDRQSKPARRRLEHTFWYTQTQSHLYLSDRVHALVQPEIDGISTHSESPIIQGGHTDWPVRLEIYGPTVPDAIARRVVMKFAPVA